MNRRTSASRNGSQQSIQSGRHIVYVTGDSVDDSLTHMRQSDGGSTHTTRKRNRWTKQQESLLVSWAEKASGYSWLHNRCINHYIKRSHYIAIPAGICGYIAGTATLINTGNSAHYNTYISTVIGIFGICAGILSNLQQIFTFKELSEQHKLSALRFQTFFHDISCELSLSPEYRAYPIDFIKMKRLEFDKMIEQSPTIPTKVRELFQQTFAGVDVHKPDNMNAIQTILPFSEDRGGGVVPNRAPRSLFSSPSFMNSGPSTLTGGDTVGTLGTTETAPKRANTTSSADAPRGSATVANRGWLLPGKEMDKTGMRGSVEVANSFVHSDVVSVASPDDMELPARSKQPRMAAFGSGRSDSATERVKKSSILPAIGTMRRNVPRTTFMDFVDKTDITTVRNVKLSAHEAESDA